MLTITRVVLQDLNVEIFKNCVKLIYHPVYGILAHTDTGKHMVHEDMYSAVNLLGKVSSFITNTGGILQGETDVKTFTAEAKD